MSTRKLTTEQRFWAKVFVVPDDDSCWLWTGGKTPKGYGCFWTGERQTYAHRFAYEILYGPIPAGLCVCHHCDTPGCCRSTHFFLGTYKDNSADARAKGRTLSGNRNPARLYPERLARGDKHHARLHPECVLRGAHNGNAVLTEEDVIEMLKLWATTPHPSKVAIAGMLGVSTSLVYHVLNGQSWNNLTGIHP